MPDLWVRLLPLFPVELTHELIRVRAAVGSNPRREVNSVLIVSNRYRHEYAHAAAPIGSFVRMSLWALRDLAVYS